MRINRSSVYTIVRARKRLTAAALLGAVFMAGAVQAAPSAGAYYDRSFVLAAHDKCGLFAPTLTSALTASALQARGAAVRGGLSADEIMATAERARSRAARTACDDPQLATVRTRVSTAFEGWSRTPRMVFPGSSSEWSADRSEFSSPTWRLKQTSSVGASPVTFGVAAGGGQAQSLRAVVSFYGRPRPYATRIVLRNAERAPGAWLPGRAERNGFQTVAFSALPPEPARRSFLAAGYTPAEPTLLSSGKAEGQAWFFPAAAADALSTLDPRETFVIEFLFRDDSVATVTFEAGDFAAGRAFLSMGAL